MVTHYFHLSNESKCLKSVSSKQHLLTMSPLKCQSKKKRKKSSSYSGGPKKEQSLITATQFPKVAILAALLKASPTHTTSHDFPQPDSEHSPLSLYPLASQKLLPACDEESRLRGFLYWRRSPGGAPNSLLSVQYEAWVCILVCY